MTYSPIDLISRQAATPSIPSHALPKLRRSQLTVSGPSPVCLCNTSIYLSNFTDTIGTILQKQK